MVEGFILPEVFSFATEDGVGFAGGDALEAIHKARNGNFWGDQKVDLVGHNHESVQDIETKFVVTEMDCFYHAASDTGVL